MKNMGVSSILAAGLLSTTVAAQSVKTDKKDHPPGTSSAFDVSKADTLIDFSKMDWGKTEASVRSVTIGSQTWAADNLNTSRFRNGDPIPEAKTKEEWLAAHKEGRPAWCY